jgi:hypothetical protein
MPKRQAMAEPQKTSWIYCNLCKGKTRHVLVASKEYNYGSRVEEGEPAEWGEYRLWACAGCDTCTMEDYYTAEYMGLVNVDEPDQDNQVYDSIYHPKRASSSRPSKHFFNLPSKLERLYSEIIKSHNEGLHLLCAAGLRSLLEGVCAEKAITGANLEKKIEGMKSLLPESIVKNLHEFRFIGNRAVHELEAPQTSELGVALDVIEDILNFLYALDYNASLLARIRAGQGEAVRPIAATPTDAAAGASISPEPARKPPEVAGD